MIVILIFLIIFSIIGVIFSSILLYLMFFNWKIKSLMQSRELPKELWKCSDDDFV